MQTFTELPKYKLTACVAVNGMAELPGREVTLIGWPKEHGLVPANPSAVATLHYYHANRSSGLPDSPVVGGRVMLPGTATPRWKALRLQMLILISARTNFKPQQELIFEGHGFSTLGWPDCWDEGAAEPASDEAAQILRYMHEHPNEPRAPIA